MWRKACNSLSSVTVAGSIGLLAVFALTIARAHIVTEAPWTPVAAAYRTMTFLGNLKPVPWTQVEKAYAKHSSAAAGNMPAKEVLEEIDAAADTKYAEAIALAIAEKDRQMLYATTTRALSHAVRYHLNAAKAALSDPGVAAHHTQSAQALYRAFDEFIRQADPGAYAELGRAWLTMMSSIGSAGLLGRLEKTPQTERFDDARKVISAYLKKNYEPETFIERDNLMPIPETVATGAGVEIAAWLPPGSNIFDPNLLPLLVLNFEEQGIDETDLPMVAYGDMLFDSPEIFGDPARSLGMTCSNCHPRSDINKEFFIPGVSHQPGASDVDNEFFNPLFNDHRDDSVDIPSLRGVRFTAPYGRDGRFGSLREFVRNVHVNEFGGAKEATPFMLDALVAYMLEFDFLPNSKLDPTGCLTGAASAAAHRGEELFHKPFAQMGGRSCASCHVPSASFVDRLAHNIGSAEPGYENSRGVAYDTPTLLGTRFTAPYFHDGSMPTLAAVVNWFDNNYKLGLSDQERADLTAYVETVGDADEPYEVFEGRHTPFRLSFEELTTFASTLNVLLPARDAYHAKLLIDTVAADLAADASSMTNRAANQKVYELSRILVGIRGAVNREAWDKAETLWVRFKAKQDEYDADMY